ncbi:hypothetical protein PMIN02_007091 [Paraphaeosphaeria minitans]
MMRQQISKRSKPIIMTTSNVSPPALSPRTTRRNMLQIELTAELRSNLLWERQQKNAIANVVNKRAPLSDAVKDYPDIATDDERDHGRRGTRQYEGEERRSDMSRLASQLANELSRKAENLVEIASKRDSKKYPLKHTSKSKRSSIASPVTLLPTELSTK